MEKLPILNSGPVDNSKSGYCKLRTASYSAVRLREGFWSTRQKVNRVESLKHGYEMLEKAGNFDNMRIAAGWKTGSFSGVNFYDEDVYKWLEALAWELAGEPDEELQRMADEVINLISAVQQPDGYLNSYFQIVEPDRKWTDLDFGHELYCAGHLFQAAIAFDRVLGDSRLLVVSRRLADHINSVFGPGKKEAACGHPEVEMALVELYRLTGEINDLQLARFFIDQRGKRVMKGMGSNGPEYHQDHAPVRDAKEVVGHAVRQMYLATAVADVFMETGEAALWETTHRLWENMTGTKMYITGGVGARYDGESFGDPYELPPDQCYCETCAAIGSLMWNWRLLLITGKSLYADLIEQTLYNGILSSPSLDGRKFFYVNPLLLRSADSFRQSTNPPEGTTVSGRPEWHVVACCPPNIMRLFSSLGHYIVTTSKDGIQVHQYIPSSLELEFAPGRMALINIDTAYPWDGQVRLEITESDGLPWTLSIRKPGWAASASLSLNGEAFLQPKVIDGYYVLNRAWQPGDFLLLDLDMFPQLIEPHPRVDAIRGCLAIQRGPIVYCLEPHDQAEHVDLMDTAIDPRAPIQDRFEPELLGGVVVVTARGYVLDASPLSTDLYLPVGRTTEMEKRPLELVAIPYFAWGNRGVESMRVWIPIAK